MKNIVLLSDGRGNGAAKKNRTNVWQLYRAPDLHLRRATINAMNGLWYRFLHLYDTW